MKPPHQETLPQSSIEFASNGISTSNGELSPGEACERFVTFLLEGNPYCIPAESVLEVVHPLPFACLPNSPSVVLGIAAFRGDVVAVVNIKEALGLIETVTSSKTKHVVLKANINETQFAVPVDSMREIISARHGSIRTADMCSSVGLKKTVEHEGIAHQVISPDFLYQIVQQSIG